MMKRKEKTSFESPERLNRLVEGTKIKGDIFADSNLRIDGEIIGNIATSSKVVIGENGRVAGNLSCLEASIEGEVTGNINVEGLLILKEKAKILGDIITSRIQVEEGATFNGKCKMGAISVADQVSMDEIQKDSSIVY
ncbi:MAG TPA: polymer-forming cytoskeletal protein [Taishania sp.]|nr:polymer-forming cytoskeletal protein [Taishania sp.]